MHRRPNIVVIMTDQQRADLVAREGYPLDTMPFCDSLARRGQWFDHAYTTSPLCVPARVSLLTGRFPSATRVRTNHHHGHECRAASDLASVARDAGYRTALCGKNHSHLPGSAFDAAWEYSHLTAFAKGFPAGTPPLTEDERRFDEFMTRTGFHLVREPTPFPLETQYAYRIVTNACSWIDAADDRPFLLWLSLPEPHNPYQVPTPYYDLFPPERLPPPRSRGEDFDRRSYAWRWTREAYRAAFPDHGATLQRARSNYHGMLRLIDDQIARFFAHLERRGLRDDTLVFVTADHGDFVGEHGLMRKGPGMPDLLVRIPFIVAGPGVAAGGDRANRAHVGLADVLPTVCGAIGADVPVGVQGRSLNGLLAGGEDAGRFRSIAFEHGFGGAAHDGTEPWDPRDDGFIPSPDGEAWGAYDCLNGRTQSGTRRGIRMGDWKLVVGAGGERALHHVASDPAELVDRWDDPTAVAVRETMQRELIEWMLRLDDALPVPVRRYKLKPITAPCP